VWVATAARSRPQNRTARFAQLVLVNGVAGAVWAPGGQPRVVFGFTIRSGRIAEIEILANPERLGQLDLEVLDE
jgi:hypothetical protein